ncbi:olfactory receptor 4F5-like [Castor canadensis]|uniref:Olfactory receptor 4F5-like n=1 Tax=Castor canadensis TaxID=51338 RepID=A0AC58LC94_CASCN
MQSTRDPAIAEFRWYAGQKGPWRLWVTRHWAFLGGWPARAKDDKNRPKPVADREIFPHSLSPRDDQKREMLKPQTHQRERQQWEPIRGVWTHQEDVQCWMRARAIRRMSPGQSRPQSVCGVSWIGVPPRLVGSPAPSHGTKLFSCPTICLLVITPMKVGLGHFFHIKIHVTAELFNWNESTHETNHSVVTEFIFLGLSNSQELQIFLFLFFLVFYVGIVFGNLLIVITVASDSYLHSPLYFLLANLSLIDLSLSSVTAPKMITDFFSKHKFISFKGCLAQIFLLHFFGGSELVILTAMAFDRYVAICKPLHYTTIMCGNVCVGIVAAAWGIGFLHSVSQFAFVLNLSFCGPNEIDSFYCDLPWVIKLVCTDTYRSDIMVIANSGVLTVCTFVLLIISYTVILTTIQHRPSDRSSKALSTLTAHIIVVLLFFGPCIFIYAWPFPIKSLDKFLAVFDSVVTPLLNPIIYTLRNKDMKTAMRRLRDRNVNSRVK